MMDDQPTKSLSQNIKTRRVSEGRPHEFPRSRVGLRFYAEGFRIGSKTTTPTVPFIACVIFLLGVGIQPLAAQSFKTSTRLTLGTDAYRSASVRAGDLDGDGDLDLVVANGRHWPQQNFAFLNKGTGQFTIMRPLGTDRATSYACELADFDGDGDLDLATGNDMAPCQIFLNDGTANFTFKENFGGVSSVRSMTVADVDGDGDQDILLACRGRANQLCLNDGQGGFHKEVEFGTGSDATIAVKTGDINGDGHLDLVLANRNNQPNAWLINDGSLNFDQQIKFGDPQSQTRAVAVGDFDADGDLDWATANIKQPNRVFLGDGKGGVKTSIEVGPPENRSYCIDAADLDDDGDLDLVVGNVGQPNSLFFNEDSGKRFRHESFDKQNHATYGLVVADINSDGRPDLVTANSDAINQVFLNAIPRNDDEKSGNKKKEKPVAEQQQNQAANTDVAESKAEPKNDTDWPNFRGVGFRGVAEGYSLPTNWNADVSSGDLKNVLWQIDVPGLGHSSPVVVGDQLFLLTAVAQDRPGDLKIEAGGGTDAAEDNGVQDWLLLCYDKSNGKERWRKTLRQGKPKATRHGKATHANTSVCVAGDRIVSFLGSEGLYCHDLDGNLLWEQDLGVIDISKYGIGWGFSSSPVIHQDRIVLLCDDPDDPFVSARKLSDGSELWRTPRKGVGERSWATPLVLQHDGDAQVVINGFPWIVSYDFSDGKERWRLKGGGDNPVPTPFVVDGLLYITNAHGGPSPIYALRPSARGELTTNDTESIAWHVGRGGSYMSTPVVYANQIYLGSSKGVLRSFDATTGKKIKQGRIGSKAGMIASLVAGDGKIFCASENGSVYVVEAGADLKVIATNKMDGPCLATPAISQGTLFIRSTKRLTAIRAN